MIGSAAFLLPEGSMVPVRPAATLDDVLDRGHPLRWLCGKFLIHAAPHTRSRGAKGSIGGSIFTAVQLQQDAPRSPQITAMLP